jgi:hypothetical protein
MRADYLKEMSPEYSHQERSMQRNPPTSTHEWNATAPAVIVVIALGACLAACDSHRSGHDRPSKASASAASDQIAAGDFEVPPPPFSEGIFPCMDCHDGMEVNPQRRQLEDEHTKIVLKHDEENRWCLDCHDPTDRDKLRLASGELVTFAESYRLCGQCHGDKYRDWRAGVHGKRSGSWNGTKRYLLCAHCHNPHQPRFKPLKPLPAPLPPLAGR